MSSIRSQQNARNYNQALGRVAALVEAVNLAVPYAAPANAGTAGHAIYLALHELHAKAAADLQAAEDAIASESVE